MTKEEHRENVSRYMSKNALEWHWSDVLYTCKQSGMIEREDATDLWNVIEFIKRAANTPFKPAEEPKNKAR